MTKTVFEHTNKKGTKYYLHGKIVTLRGGQRKQQIYFFGKQVKSKEALSAIPAGFKVVENAKTGLPVLKHA